MCYVMLPFLDITDIAALRSVSKSFYDAIKKNTPFACLSHLNMSENRFASALIDLRALTQFKCPKVGVCLERLGEKLTVLVAKFAFQHNKTPQCTRLTHIELKTFDCPDFSLFNECKDLVHLDIRYNTCLCELNLNNCTNLLHLNLNSVLDIRTLDFVSRCTKLQFLNLDHAGPLEQVNTLLNCTNLTHLNLNNALSLTHLNLHTCTRLVHLDVFSVNSISAEFVSRCTSLKTLIFHNQFPDLEMLRHCTNLTELYMIYSDRILSNEPISNCTRLTRLESLYYDIDDLHKCTNIKYLELRYATMTRSLDVVSNFVHLVELFFWCSPKANSNKFLLLKNNNFCVGKQGRIPSITML